ncbi:MAG: hypothetical protein JSW58_13805 [Candidatus Latescibacterota bacterium]|nr:MAG: hypothetical protein JSW58_13805 [Candidatus Latescibacterota bacterium]
MKTHLFRTIPWALRISLPLVLLLNFTGCSNEDVDFVAPQSAESQNQLAKGEFGQVTTRAVQLDIRPGPCPSPLNARSQGVFQATVLGAEDFDVHDIEMTSLRLEGIAPIRAKVKDKLSPGCNGDSNGDGSGDDFDDEDEDADEDNKGQHRTAAAPTADNIDNDRNDDDADDKLIVDPNQDKDEIVGDRCECMFHGEDYTNVCTVTRHKQDGFDDLDLKFPTGDVIAALGAVSTGEVVVLTLTGSLDDGTTFEARDCVRIVGKPQIEMISTPSRPTGPHQTTPGLLETYCTEGATSSEGHPIEYQFDFDADGAHAISEWTESPCAQHFWSTPDEVVVKARARCALHPDRMSEWSEGLTVSVGQVTELPEIHFTTSITKVIDGTPTTITKPYDPAVLDTVGMIRPFAISYHGTTVNGMIRAYKFFSMTPGVELEGENLWTTDLTDTLRFFPNRGAEKLPSGVFQLGVQCRDDAGAESPVDAVEFTEGVCQIAVNYDPDTRIIGVLSSYVVGGQPQSEYLDFTDEVPDTVPFRSWITLMYDGWDSPFDSSLCQDDINKCLTYQVNYTRDSDRVPGANATIRWLPDGGEDNNPFGTADSTSMNVGSLEYEIRARSIDENNRPDGTPATVQIVGNFDPTLDTFWIRNHDGTMVPDTDTLVWDWWNPAREGFNLEDPTNVLRFKEFYFVIEATGHDHWKDPDGSGVKSWYYEFRHTDDPSRFEEFGRANSWVEGITVNALSDTFRVRFEYPFEDVNGDSVFDNLPPWVNEGYDYIVKGRDTANFEEFSQFMYVNGQKTLINQYTTSSLGRWTQEGSLNFYFVMRRDTPVRSDHQTGFFE